MQTSKPDKDIRCPLEYGLDIFSGKWKTRIICLLGANGTMRYNEIRRDLASITDAVLAASLKEMVSDALVERTQYNEVPPRVEYALTPKKGVSAFGIMKSICRWSVEHVSGDTSFLLPSCKKNS